MRRSVRSSNDGPMTLRLDPIVEGPDSGETLFFPPGLARRRDALGRARGLSLGPVPLRADDDAELRWAALRALGLQHRRNHRGPCRDGPRGLTGCSGHPHLARLGVLLGPRPAPPTSAARRARRRARRRATRRAGPRRDVGDHCLSVVADRRVRAERTTRRLDDSRARRRHGCPIAARTDQLLDELPLPQCLARHSRRAREDRDGCLLAAGAVALRLRQEETLSVPFEEVDRARRDDGRQGGWPGLRALGASGSGLRQDPRRLARSEQRGVPRNEHSLSPNAYYNVPKLRYRMGTGLRSRPGSASGSPLPDGRGAG